MGNNVLVAARGVGKHSLERYAVVTRPFPRRRVQFGPYGQCLRQVFGLTGCLVTPASQFTTEPVPMWSFRS